MDRPALLRSQIADLQTQNHRKNGLNLNPPFTAMPMVGGSPLKLDVGTFDKLVTSVLAMARSRELERIVSTQSI